MVWEPGVLHNMCSVISAIDTVEIREYYVNIVSRRLTTYLGTTNYTAAFLITSFTGQNAFQLGKLKSA